MPYIFSREDQGINGQYNSHGNKYIGQIEDRPDGNINEVYNCTSEYSIPQISCRASYDKGYSEITSFPEFGQPGQDKHDQYENSYEDGEMRKIG